MLSQSWAMALGLACVMTAGLRADDNSDDLKQLAGTWIVMSATLDGKAVDDMKDLQIVIAKDKLTTKSKDGKEKQFGFKVDSSQKPKTIDLAIVEKVPDEDPGLVIYDINGDELKLVNGPPDKRPTEFTDNGQVLVVLKRKK